MSRQLDKINKEIAILEAKKREIKNKTVAKCYHCNKGTQIPKLTYYQLMHYISPYSCIGGDYWLESDEAFWVCPKCSKLVWLADKDGRWRQMDYAGTYRMRHPLNPQHKKLIDLKYTFKDVKKIYWHSNQAKINFNKD